MILLLAGAIVGALGLATWLALGPFATRHHQTLDVLEALSTSIAGSEDLRLRLVELEDAVDRLPAKWEDVKRESSSLYHRTRHHIRRTQDQLAERGLEDPELDQLAFEVGGVRERNAEGGGGEGVQPVPSGVENPPPPPWAPPSMNDIIAAKWRM